MQSGEVLEDLRNLPALRDAPSIPEKDDRAAQMTKERAEKEAHLGLGDVVEMEVDIQPQPLAPRADGHRRDR